MATCGLEDVLCCLSSGDGAHPLARRGTVGPMDAFGRVQSSWTSSFGECFIFMLGGRLFLAAPQSVLPSAAASEYASAFFTAGGNTIGIRADANAFFATTDSFKLVNGARVPCPISVCAVTDPRARSLGVLRVALDAASPTVPGMPVQHITRNEESGRVGIERGAVSKVDGLITADGVRPHGTVTPLLNGADEVVAVGTGGAAFVPFTALLRQIGFVPKEGGVAPVGGTPGRDARASLRASSPARSSGSRRSPSPAPVVPQVDKDATVYVGDEGTAMVVTGKFHVREGCHGARVPMCMSEALAQRRIICQSCQPYQGGSVLDELRAFRDLFTSKKRREHVQVEPEVSEVASALRSKESPLRKSWKARTRSSSAGLADDDDDARSTLSLPSLNLSEADKQRTTVFVGEGGPTRGAYHFRENCAGARRPMLLTAAEGEGRAMCVLCAPRGRGDLVSESRGLREFFGQRLFSIFS
eukprot:tig00001067_g6787.t1